MSTCCLFGFEGIFCLKQKTAYEMRISDWSSDVCSSDLLGRRGCWQRRVAARGHEGGSSVSRARPVLPWRDRTHPRRRHVRHRLRRRREGDGSAWRAGARGGGSRRDGRGGKERNGRASCRERGCENE